MNSKHFSLIVYVIMEDLNLNQSLKAYGLFEPLLIDYKDNKLFRHPTTRYAYMYDPNIFEKRRFSNIF